jgi:hypothetical protein
MQQKTPQFSRQQFEEIAVLLAQALVTAGLCPIHSTTHQILAEACKRLAKTNPKFNHGKFVTAIVSSMLYFSSLPKE